MFIRTRPCHHRQLRIFQLRLPKPVDAFLGTHQSALFFPSWTWNPREASCDTFLCAACLRRRATSFGMRSRPVSFGSVWNRLETEVGSNPKERSFRKGWIRCTRLDAVGGAFDGEGTVFYMLWCQEVHLGDNQTKDASLRKQKLGPAVPAGTQDHKSKQKDPPPHPNLIAHPAFEAKVQSRTSSHTSSADGVCPPWSCRTGRTRHGSSRDLPHNL